MRFGFAVIVAPPDPTTVNAAQETPEEHVTVPVAMFCIPLVADPYSRLPATKEVWPVPPCATDKAAPRLSAFR